MGVCLIAVVTRVPVSLATVGWWLRPVSFRVLVASSPTAAMHDGPLQFPCSPTLWHESLLSECLEAVESLQETHRRFVIELVAFEADFEETM